MQTEFGEVLNVRLLKSEHTYFEVLLSLNKRVILMDLTDVHSGEHEAFLMMYEQAYAHYICYDTFSSTVLR